MKFLHMTIVRIAPQNVPQVVEKISLRQQACSSTPINGLRQWSLVESQDEPGKLIWLALWEERSQAQAFLSSPQYADQVILVRNELLSGPEWYGFSVLNPGQEYKESDTHYVDHAE